MDKQIKLIMLIDDNKIDNFFHERAIKKHNPGITVTAYISANEALNAIQTADIDMLPDLIFLDINMPGMNGWEFLDAYFALDEKYKKSQIITMLSTSENPEDMKVAEERGVRFSSKPLTAAAILEIQEKFLAL